MLHVDGILGSSLLGVYGIMCAIVEDDTVLQDFAYAGSLMLVGSLQDFHCSCSICCHGTCEEVSACSKAQFCRAERILHGAVWAALADKTAWACGAVLSLGKSVDTVVEQNHIEVDVASVGMYEVIASDGQSVTVSAHLPYCEFRIGHLTSGGNGGCTSVDGVHSVCGHVMRQTAGASYTRDDGCIPWCHAYFSHCLVQRSQEEVVSASGTPSGLSFFIIVSYPTFPFH